MGIKPRSVYRIGYLILAATLLPLLAIPDCVKRESTTKRLSPQAIYVAGDNSYATLSNKDTNGDGRLETVLKLNLDGRTEIREVVKDAHGKVEFREIKTSATP